MDLLSIGIAAGIGIWFLAAVRYLWRHRGGCSCAQGGGCPGCQGCREASSCPGCQGGRRKASCPVCGKKEETKAGD